VPDGQIPMEELDAKEDLSCQEYSVKIQETSERVMRVSCNGVTTPRKKLLGREKKS
jgi:hypothetical protein